MSVYKNQNPEAEAKRTLVACHGLISENRDTGNGIYLIARRYPTGDVEMVGIRLESEDTLKRGGGAKRKNNTKTEMDLLTLHKSVQRARVNVRRKVLTIAAVLGRRFDFGQNDKIFVLSHRWWHQLRCGWRHDSR